MLKVGVSLMKEENIERNRCLISGVLASVLLSVKHMTHMRRDLHTKHKQPSSHVESCLHIFLPAIEVSHHLHPINPSRSPATEIWNTSQDGGGRAPKGAT